jgi:hypothetical protein
LPWRSKPKLENVRWRMAGPLIHTESDRQTQCKKA